MRNKEGEMNYELGMKNDELKLLKANCEQRITNCGLWTEDCGLVFSWYQVLVVIEAFYPIKPTFFKALLGWIPFDDSVDEANACFFDGGVELFRIGVIDC